MQLLQNALFEVMRAYDWRLQAWAVFSNHYHFIGQTPEEGETLKTMLQRLHSQTAREVNRLDDTRGRQVWFQFRDTCLTYEKSGSSGNRVPNGARDKCPFDGITG